MGILNSTVKSESLECLLGDVMDSAASQSKRLSHIISSTAANNLTKISLMKIERSRFYPASLLDYYFEPLRKGVIILEEKDLIFRYTTNEQMFVMVWPLCGLRWYGGNSSTFVFESGRRCKLGPGYFLFKCKRSRQLTTNIKKQIELLRCRESLTTVHNFSFGPPQIVDLSKCPVPYHRFMPDQQPDARNPPVDHNAGNSRLNTQGLSSVLCVDSSGDYITLQQNNTESSTVYVSYPNLLGSGLISTHSNTNNYQFEGTKYDNTDNSDEHSYTSNNYLQIVPLIPSLPNQEHTTNDPRTTNSDFGQYLIALASHLYVNQSANTNEQTLVTTATECVNNNNVQEPV